MANLNDGIPVHADIPSSLQEQREAALSESTRLRETLKHVVEQLDEPGDHDLPEPSPTTPRQEAL